MTPIIRRTASWIRRDSVEPRIGGADFGKDRPDQRHVGKVVDREQAGPQSVIDVVVVVAMSSAMAATCASALAKVCRVRGPVRLHTRRWPGNAAAPVRADQGPLCLNHHPSRVSHVRFSPEKAA
jgi:hypothetical protein